MHAIGPTRWFHWVAAAGLLAAATLLLWPAPARVAMPELPVMPPTPVVRGVPTRAVPCVASGDVTLRVLDGAPVVCGEADCMRLDLEQRTASLVARPPAPVALPLAAPVAGIAAGKRLAAALAHATHSAATLDRSTVVVDDAIWNVAADREVTLRRPETLPNGPEHEVTIAGDVLLVRWQGSCTDSACLASQLVDRRGRELGWALAGGGLLRIDDQHFVTVSEFSTLQIRDLHTGALASELEPRLSSGGFRGLAVLCDHADYLLYAVLRDAGDGVSVTPIELTGGSILVHDADQMTLPTCLGD